MENISERRGSRVITYYISEEGYKFPSFDWMLKRAEMEEDKTSIFRLVNQTLIFSKSDFNSFVVMYHKTEYGWTDRFIGVYNDYVYPSELVLTHVYQERTISLNDIERWMCDGDGGLTFSFDKINIS